jgi:hypothetical protein
VQVLQWQSYRILWYWNKVQNFHWQCYHILKYYYKEPASTYHTAILDGSVADFPSAFVYHPVEMRATPTTVFEALLRFDYNSGSAGANFTPSGGTTAYAGNTRLGVSRKNSISNAPASSNSQRNGQWDVQLSFSAEL